MQTHYTSRPITGQTDIELKEERVLRIRTETKRGLGLVSTATVFRAVDGQLKHEEEGDFSKVLKMQIRMATGKAVLVQHTEALSTLDALKREISMFYRDDADGHCDRGLENTSWN